MKTLTYRTIIQKDGKGYHGFVPALIGCHTYGETIEKVRVLLQEAIKAWIESREVRGWKVPMDDTLETLESVQINTKISSGAKLTYA